MTQTGFRIDIDREVCMGSGVCANYAPRTFVVDDTCIAVVTDPGGDPPDAIEVAASACPTGAIALTPNEGASR